MGKTPDYVKKAVASYRDRYDFFSIKTEKGTKERAAAVGLDSVGISSLILAEIEKREAAASTEDVPF